MADDFFKVRNGFTVGEDAFTVDAATGDVTVTGDLIFNGSTSGQVSLTAPAVAGTQAYTLPTALPASNGYVLSSQTDGTMSWVSNSDANTTYTQNFTSTSGGTNLNLVGSDSTTDTVKFANGTGVTVSYTDADTATIAIGQDVATTANPQFAGATLGNITVGVSTDNTIASTDTNGNITLDPNGTGNVVMTFANGGNLTNDRNYVSGIIRQTAAASAGDVYGFNTGSTNPYRGISIDNTASSTTTTGKRTGLVMRNYANAPRNSIIGETARGTNPSSPTQLTNNSNIIELVAGGWAGVSDGTGFTSTGSTISGTTLTIGTLVSGTVAVGQLISSWTAGVNVTTGTTITANISGSGSGSTWTVSQSQTVASSAINGGGDGWLSSLGALGGAIRLQAFENWTNQTSGTGVVVSLSPLSSTLGLAGATFNALTMSLSSTTLASDTQAFRTRPAGAGGTNFNMLNLTESLVTVGGDLRINGNDIQASDGNTNITMTSNTLTTLAGNLKVGGNTIQNSAGQTNILMTSDRSQTTINSNATTIQDPGGSGNNVLMEFGPAKSAYALYGVSTDASVVPTVNYNGYRRVAGNNVATKTDDRLGQFTFNGNINTGTGGPSSNVVGGEFRVYATEDWDNTKAGTGVGIEITKQGTNTNTNVFISNVLTTEVTGDTIILQNSTSSDYLTLNSTSATFTQPVGFPVKTASQWNAITGAIGQQVCVSDSAQGSNPNGMMAFWDTTNSRWSYIHDNSAV